MSTPNLLATISDSTRLSREDALSLCGLDVDRALLAAASSRRDRAHGVLMSYSKKVFIPLTRLCRDVCHYCTFAKAPKVGEPAFMTPEQVLSVARAGRAAGCREALFTLGDKPELRYRAAREELAALGYPTTLAYLAAMARLVLDETGLFPHLNPGVMERDDLLALRRVSLSQGIMLEGVADRLALRGGPHHGSPDKQPEARLRTIEAAGECRVPFTSGILIGIGETREDRIAALLALRDLHDRYGHIQEIIVQNFQPKPSTRMAGVPPVSIEEHCWTIAVARLLFDPAMNIQAPPNLSSDHLARLIDAGINDWGGISPVTPDYVNPEAPWPQIASLADEAARAGKQLVERTALYPSYVRDAATWIDSGLHAPLAREVDAEGWPRTDDWHPGLSTTLPIGRGSAPRSAASAGPSPVIVRLLAKAEAGELLDEHDVVELFRARGHDFDAVCAAADRRRWVLHGDTVSYVVNRNINYTNICSYRCQFCAFSKGKLSESLRGRPYNLDIGEVVRRAVEARERGATEVCMQGGIHPAYTGQTYLDICSAVKDAVPDIHVHAFSPLEVWQGAKTLGLSVEAFLSELKRAGLSSLPGTAAEILDDGVRAVLCPDKISTADWVHVMRSAHELGIRSTATIMFGHVDTYADWARHLILVRDLQIATGGFTEFVPLPFVHMEAPIYLKGRSRPGPTFRETILMHAVARLALHPYILNIQASWVKMGEAALGVVMAAGVNDLGGTLMDESISRSAGAVHGQEMTPARMEALIRSAGRDPQQRATFYGAVAPDQVTRSTRPRQVSLSGTFVEAR